MEGVYFLQFFGIIIYGDTLHLQEAAEEKEREEREAEDAYHEKLRMKEESKKLKHEKRKQQWAEREKERLEQLQYAAPTAPAVFQQSTQSIEGN